MAIYELVDCLAAKKALDAAKAKELKLSVCLNRNDRLAIQSWFFRMCELDIEVRRLRAFVRNEADNDEDDYKCELCRDSITRAKEEVGRWNGRD